MHAPNRRVFPCLPVPQRGELNAVPRCATLRSTELKKYSWIYMATTKFVQYRLYFFKFIDKHISALSQRDTIFLKFFFCLFTFVFGIQSKTKTIARFGKSVTDLERIYVRCRHIHIPFCYKWYTYIIMYMCCIVYDYTCYFSIIWCSWKFHEASVSFYPRYESIICTKHRIFFFK